VVFLRHIYPRAPGNDREVAAFFSAVQTLERKHVPAAAAKRVDLATAADSPCIAPGLALDDLAASFVGLSLDYAVVPHCDNAAPGTSESMVFSAGAGGPFPMYLQGYEVCTRSAFSTSPATSATARPR